ncbi:phage antirepressor N-terminal domain-containing protein [Proteus vulgaris]|uniref:phage antirepressor N-terminal domain-containing protein n=1 Tax=Proteus vulgaris TaxID=585 RepID=UPI001FFF453E|nr:phage antirepressor N-terminal domain-containing protein [Proteus vulgaris]UPK82446.1 phage antirepressor N-terminal domain-containing protein [Proteus vulgaris]
MNTISTINVPFHGNNLCIVNHDGRPYVPMKPIVEGMGLSWEPQLRKLNQRFAKGMIKMVIPSIGGAQETVCLAMHKLTGWLFSIMPNKVKPEIRDKVIKYQEECDDVLYEYWTTGEVKKKHKSTVQERNPLKNAVNLLVSKKGIMYPEAYSLVHQKFNVSSIEELTADQIPDAVEYIHKFVLEGEYIPKDDQKEKINTRVNSNLDAHNIKALLNQYEAIYTAWKVDLYPALRSVDSPIAGSLYDRFKDGYSFLMLLHKSITGKHIVLTK